MKKVMTAFVVVGMTCLISWAITRIAGGRISEYIFFTSLVVTVIIRYFTSQGGLSTNAMKLIMQSQFRMKVDGDAPIHMKGDGSFAFIVSLILTIVTAVYTVFMYWRYF